MVPTPRREAEGGEQEKEQPQRGMGVRRMRKLLLLPPPLTRGQKVTVAAALRLQKHEGGRGPAKNRKVVSIR